MQAAVQEDIEGMTPVQYARARGVTLGYVYTKIWDGTLPARKVLGRWVIPPEAIEARSPKAEAR